MTDPAGADEPAAPPPAWLVYPTMALLVPAGMWATVMVMTLLSLGLALYEIADAGRSIGDLGPIAQGHLSSLFDRPVAQLVAGVLGASSMMALAALALVARRSGGQGRRDHAWARLRIAPVAVVDVGLSVAAMLSFTIALDGAIVVAGLEDVGALAELRATVSGLDLAERLLLSLVVAGCPGLAEELYFRGFFLGWLELRHGRTAAIVVSSLVFGAFHLDVVQSPVTALMGLYLAALVLITGSLWTAIAAHTINNLCAVAFADTSLSGTASIVAIPLGLMASGALLTVLRRRHRGEVHRAVW